MRVFLRASSKICGLVMADDDEISSNTFDHGGAPSLWHESSGRKGRKDSKSVVIAVQKD